MNVRSTTARLAGVAALVAVSVAWPATPAMAVAPGCTTTHPTAIGGDIYGYGGSYNNWSVQVQVGMDLVNSAGQKVDIDGNLTSGYSYSDWVNPGLGQPGASSGYERTWGESGTNDYLCVASNVVQAFFEVYPKNGSASSQYTDRTYYGMANDYFDPITPGATNTYNLRIPTGHVYGQTYWGGNTGDLNGYVTYGGHKVDPQKLTFRVRPDDGVKGTDCGVQGGAIGADAVGYSSSLDATYYDITFLAGGQCGATYQEYKLYVYCDDVCGATQVSRLIHDVQISNGSRPRVDVAF
ncbi:MAG TPA: hypothetical protein VF519_11570 [Mycobacteriales bacterium]|jgi:hypothetical protein